MTASVHIPSRARSALLVLLASGLVAACGSDDEPPSVPNPDIATATTQQERPDRERSEELPEDDVDVSPTGPGLGDDGGDSSAFVSGPSGPGKAAFVAFVDRVCTRFRRDSTRLGGEPSDRARRLAALLGAAIDTLSGPPVPARDAGAFRGYLERLRDQRRLLQDLDDAGRQGDRRAIVRITRRVTDVGGRARSRARAYGLRVCGSS